MHCIASNYPHSALYSLNLRIGCPIVSKRLQPANTDETKEVAMRHRFTWLLLLGAAVAGTALSYSAHVWATPPIGFKATTIATGTFAEFEVFNHSIVPNPNGDGDNDRDDKSLWLSLQKTRGASDLYVQSNVWPAVDPSTGTVSSTGWHTHPGHSLIILTGGTITEYDADCHPVSYTFVPGQPAPTLVDPGHGHIHIIRNEGSVPATSIAVQLVPYDPAKKNRRIDVPVAPPNCPNIQ